MIKRFRKHVNKRFIRVLQGFFHMNDFWLIKLGSNSTELYWFWDWPSDNILVIFAKIDHIWLKKKNCWWNFGGNWICLLDSSQKNLFTGFFFFKIGSWDWKLHVFKVPSFFNITDRCVKKETSRPIKFLNTSKIGSKFLKKHFLQVRSI